MVARVLYVYGHVCLIRNDSICLMLYVRVSRTYFASIGQNGIFDKPFVSYQWYGENCEIKFVEFVSVVFLTNPNLSSTKISKTKSTQIQIMKFNSNSEKHLSKYSSFFFIFWIIFKSEHTFYYSGLLFYSVNLNTVHLFSVPSLALCQQPYTQLNFSQTLIFVLFNTNCKAIKLTVLMCPKGHVMEEEVTSSN